MCGKSKGSFLLANFVQQVNKINAGLCPHGLPPGACPICSNMGGGGGNRIGERPQKAGEMSYHQCAMIGAMMAARARRIEQHEKNLLARSEFLQTFQQNLEKMIQKMLNFSNIIEKSFLFKPASFTINNVVVPSLKFIKNIPNTINNFINKLSNLKQKVFDIQDKLNAIFGETKAFLLKKIENSLDIIKQKISKLFKIFTRDNTKNDDTKIDDDKKIFNLKTILHKIKSKLKKDDSKNKSRS